MPKLLAFVALALLCDVSVALCQSSADRPPRHARQIDKPAPAPLPDPVTWMGNAVSDILTGKVVDDLAPAPATAAERH